MFGENPYYHATIKNSIVAFGNLFSDIYIHRQDDAGSTVNVFKCPISFARKQQWYQRLNEDPDFKKKFETELPRLSFEIVSYAYNPERKLGNKQNIIVKDYSTDIKVVGAPVPYRLSFELHSYCKNQEDSLQILEQILPFFQPSLLVNIVLLPTMNLSMDFPVVFDGVTVDDNYQDLSSNRLIVQTFNFSMEINLFGPIDNSVTVIKEAIIDINTRRNSIIEPYDEQYRAVVNPREANKGDVHTIDEMWAGANL